MMKINVALLSLLSGCSVYSANAADMASYYTITEIVDIADSTQKPPFGPYPTAVSGDGSQIALTTRNFSLEHTWDTNLPFTVDQGCFYSSAVCDYKRYGSTEFPFGWSKWREALRLASSNGYMATDLSYLLVDGEAGTLPGLEPDVVFQDPTSNINSSDSVITAFTQDGMQLTGSASAPFVLNTETNQYEREFSRRAFARTSGNTLSCSLLPTAFGADLAADRGGLSAAYGINTQVTTSAINSGAVSTLVVGTASVGLPDNGTWSSYDACQTGDDFEFYRCPGFNTQAWGWDLAGCVNGDEELTGMPLAQNWINVDGGNPAYTASAMAINNQGIAAGMSTYVLSDSSSSGRARATYFMADDNGDYQMHQVKGLSAGFSDFNSTVRHTWSVDINNNYIVGNLLYNSEKGRNRPVEFFVYDMQTEQAIWPLKNIPQSGSNSQAHAINNNNMVIGWQDAVGEDQPTINGTSRRQSAFLYSIDKKKSWRLTDLTCSVEEGKSVHPRYKVVYPKAISDNDEIIATAYKYPTNMDYINNTNPTALLIKLTPNPAVAIESAPLCSSLFADLEAPKYKRKGAALWSLLPLLVLTLLVRNRKKLGFYHKKSKAI